MATKKQLEDENADLRHEIQRFIALAHKALGAMEPNHTISVVGQGKKYIEEMINEGRARP